MKRILAAVAATLALGTLSAHAEQAGFPQPSFKDTTDITPERITGEQTYQHQFPKSSYASGTGPKGPATVVIDATDSAQSASTGSAARSDTRPHSTLNDSFKYPY